MKKFFLSLSIGLFAFLGVFFGVGSSSTNLSFLVNDSLKNAFSIDNSNSITFYLDNSLDFYNSDESLEGLAYIHEDSNCIITYYLIDGTTFVFDLTSYISDNLNLGTYELSLYAFSDLNYFEFYNISEGAISLAKRDSNSSWYTILGTFNDQNYKYINGFTINGLYSIKSNIINDYESYINNIIGDLTSFPNPPSPPSEDFLDDISSTINGVIDWFVDLFNGLSDIFVITDSTGTFVGFSLWGNILFIQVSIGLVIIVLRWVISLIKGV